MWWRAVLAGVVALNMSGCAEAPLSTSASNSTFSEETIAGKSFSGETAHLALATDTSGAVKGDTTSRNASVFFLSADVAEVTLLNGTRNVNRQADGSYVSDDGAVAMIFGPKIKQGPATPDVLYFTLIFTTVGGGVFQEMLVSGNATDPGALPAGLATYRGKTVLANDAMTQRVGDITLNADFANSVIRADIQNALPSGSSAELTMGETALSNGSFSGTLTSTGVTVTDSAISGSIYGPQGNQAAGVLRVETTTEGVAGLFGASSD